MRTVEIGWQRYTKVVAVDEKGSGNANHSYQVEEAHPQMTDVEGNGRTLGVVSFQNGPIKEAGINGVMNEDLIVMILDRLEGFQTSPFKCRENAIAITKLEEALLWLNKRTLDRERRNVEGTHTV